jgi:hypothetical protein
MKQCLSCDRSETDVPLVTLSYREETLFICPQCLPVLIHKPQNLVGKLEGADQLSPVEHEDD